MKRGKLYIPKLDNGSVSKLGATIREQVVQDVETLEWKHLWRVQGAADALHAACAVAAMGVTGEMSVAATTSGHVVTITPLQPAPICYNKNQEVYEHDPSATVARLDRAAPARA